MTDDMSCHTERMLTREGVRCRGSLRNSPELAALRKRLGTGARSLVRIDTRDPSHAHVLDEDRGTWIQVGLASPGGLSAR